MTAPIYIYYIILYIILYIYIYNICPQKMPPSPKIQHPKGTTCSNIAISNGRSRLHGLVQHWMGPHLQHHQLSEHLPGALQRRCQVHRAAQPALPVLRWQLLQACAGHRADERNRSAATQWKVTRHGQLTGLELRSGEPWFK